MSDQSNACWWVTHTLNFSAIQKNVKTIIIKSKDDCVLSLIDKLVDSSNNNNGASYLQTLAAIRWISDGYVSEYFDEVGIKLFYNSFNNLFKQIYTKNSKYDSPLEKIIIQSIGVSIADAKNPAEEKKRLEGFITKRVLSLKLDVNQKLYLDQLKKKIYVNADNQ